MELFFCVAIPLLLLFLILGAVAWFARRRPSPDHAKAPNWTDDAFRDTLVRMRGTWVSQGRLPRESAAQVLALLREDHAQTAQPIQMLPATDPTPTAATPAPPATPTPAMAVTPATPAATSMAL